MNIIKNERNEISNNGLLDSINDIKDVRHITEHQADGSKVEQEHDGTGKTAVVCSQCTLHDTACQSGYVTSTFRVRQHVAYKKG